MALPQVSRGVLVKNASLLVLYVGVAKLGLRLDAVSGFATLVWAPTGLSLAALLLFGYELAPGILLGALAVNAWTGASVPVALGIAAGNTLEAILGAYVLRRWAGFRSTFGRLRHVIGLIAAATASTFVSATIGVVSLRLGGIISATDVWRTFRTWWVGDMLGDLVVAPLLLVWATTHDLKVPLRRPLEAVLLGAFVASASILVFFGGFAGVAYPVEFSYVLFPLFTWAALRFQLRGATLITLLASVLSIWATLRGSGPFVRETPTESLFALQTFMGCAGFTSLVTAGAISDRARAIRTRENFLIGVSHDLKNPLNAIQMSAHALAKSVPEVSPSRIEKHALLVQRSVDHMVHLIGDLLDAAAIDAGRMSVEPRDVSVRGLVTEAIDLLGPVARARKHELRAATVENLWVTCDRGRVLQVLSNLVGNAVKFSQEDADIVLGVDRQPRAARFWVRDRGVGIEPAQLRHVFERYWHTSPTLGGESGLGLFLAKGIVEAHGGRIWAESQVGIGTVFHFTLPLSPRSSNRSAASDRPSSREGRADDRAGAVPLLEEPSVHASNTACGGSRVGRVQHGEIHQIEDSEGIAVVHRNDHARGVSHQVLGDAARPAGGITERTV
jgi:signal transduction histidine kinase